MPTKPPQQRLCLLNEQTAPVQATALQVSCLHPCSSRIPLCGPGRNTPWGRLASVAVMRSSCTQVYTWHGVVLELTADAEGLEDITDVVYACRPQPAP